MQKSAQIKQILLVLDFLEPGGGTRVNINLARALAKKYQITLLTGITNEERSIALLKEFKPFCQKIFTYPNITTENNWQLWRIFSGTLKSCFRVMSKPDLIIFNLPISAIAILFYSRFWSVPKYYLFHDRISFDRQSLYSRAEIESWSLLSRLRFMLKNQLYDLAQKLVILLTKKVFVLSEYTQQIVARLVPSQAEKTQLIHPPTEVKLSSRRSGIKTQLNLQAKEQLIVVASRIEPRKGIQLLLAASKVLRERFKQKFKLLIFGPIYQPDYFQKLNDYLVQHRLFSQVQLAGHLNHAQLLEVMREADLVVMPSVQYETLGVTTLEALSLGTPVIGFNQGATPFILKQIDSRLIARAVNESSLAKTMHWLLTMDSKQKTLLKQKAKKLIRQIYNEQNFLQELEQAVKNEAATTLLW